MKLKLGFTGDIAFSEYTKDIAKKSDSIEEKILKKLNENDYNILNFESPITDSTITKKSALAHKSEKDNLKFITKTFKNPILSIANNHMMDFGIKGLVDTIKNIKNEQIPFIGAGLNADEATNYIIVGEDLKVGILSFQYKNYLIATKETPGTAHDYHAKVLKKKIKKLRKECDWVVLVYHGGDEFLNTPLPHTRKKYKKFLKWGVDILVGHHPHTVQGYEQVKNKIIFYSLGNFIFDTDFQRAQKGTDEGIIINLEFSKEDYKYDVLSLKKNRSINKIKLVSKNKHFVSVPENYKTNWVDAALSMKGISKNKKTLRYYRNNYSVSNLYITSTGHLQLMDFDKLVKENYIPELDEKVMFNDHNIIVRKLRKKSKKLRKVKEMSKDEIYRKLNIMYAKKTNRKNK